MQASLTAQVDLWDIAVFAELVVWEMRPDLQVLCAGAQTRGCLDEDAIDAILPGIPARGRSNLLRHLRYIHLIDRSASLTHLGRRCASLGEAPAWEQGAYYLLAASHPLFGCHVLDFKRCQGDAFDRDFDNLEPIPNWLRADAKRVFTSALDRSTRFSLGAFPAARGTDSVCRRWEMEPGALRWEIDLETGRNRWTIEGHLGTAAERRSFKSAPESAEPSELVGLFGEWESRWDARQGLVAMEFDGKMAVGGRETFRRNMSFEHVRVGRFGTFDEVVVRDVPVGPATDRDARSWASAIVVAQTEAADAYVAPPTWRAAWSDAIEHTPLSGRAGDVPDVANLRQVAGRPLRARTGWLLSAGQHLRMET